MVNVTVKRRDQTRHVWIAETNEGEPLMTHRNSSLVDIKTGDVLSSRDQHGEKLLIGYVVSYRNCENENKGKYLTNVMIFYSQLMLVRAIYCGWQVI